MEKYNLNILSYFSKILPEQDIYEIFNRAPASEYVINIIKKIKEIDFKVELQHTDYSGPMIEIRSSEVKLDTIEKKYYSPSGKILKNIKIRLNKDDKIVISLSSKGPFYSVDYYEDHPHDRYSDIVDFSRNSLGITKEQIKKILNEFNLIYIDSIYYNNKIEGTKGFYGEEPGSVCDFLYFT